MSVRSAQSITVDFTTRAFATGAATNADSLPTGTLVVNGTDNGATVTVTNKGTGIYKAAVTLPTLAVGDVVQLRIAATMSTVVDNAVIWTDSKDVVIDSAGLVDANAVKVGPSGSGTAQTARDLGTSVLLSVGTGTGQVNLASGKVPATLASTDVTGNVAADLQTIKTQAVTCAAGVTVSPYVGSTGAAVNGTTVNTLAGHDPGATLGTSTLTQADIRTATGLGSANLDTQLNAIYTVAGLVQARTDNLPSDPADASDIAASFSTVNSTLATIAGYIDTEVAAIKAKTDNLPSSPAATGDAMTLTSGERDSIAAALLDLANGVETGFTCRQSLRLMLAALAGKLSGAGTTTIVIRDVTDSKDRITATCDSSGNRSAVTRDVS